jgi:hypothetical protein
VINPVAAQISSETWSETMKQLPKATRDQLLSSPDPQCVSMTVNGLFAFVIKLDDATIEGFRGQTPIAMARGRVLSYRVGFGLTLDIFDDPDASYQVETFLNLNAPDDLRLPEMLTGRMSSTFTYSMTGKLRTGYPNEYTTERKARDS